MKKAIVAAIAVAAVAPIAASAGLSTVYQKSLDACSTAIAREFRRSEVTDTFHRRLDDGRHEIYANVVTNPHSSAPGNQRVTCQTNNTGRTVLEMSARDGRWIEGERG